MYFAVAAAAVRHCTSATRATVSRNYRRSSFFIINISSYERTYFAVPSTPLGSTAVDFVRPRLTYEYTHTHEIIPLFAIAGMREAAGGRQPAPGNPPLYVLQ